MLVWMVQRARAGRGHREAPNLGGNDQRPAFFGGVTRNLNLGDQDVVGEGARLLGGRHHWRAKQAAKDKLTE